MNRTQQLINKARAQEDRCYLYSRGKPGYTSTVQGAHGVSVEVKHFTSDDKQRVTFEHSLCGRISRKQAEEILAGRDWRHVICD